MPARSEYLEGASTSSYSVLDATECPSFHYSISLSKAKQPSASPFDIDQVRVVQLGLTGGHALVRPLLAHRVISLLRGNQLAFGAKRKSRDREVRPVWSQMTQSALRHGAAYRSE